jgi:GTP-binding protein
VYKTIRNELKAYDKEFGSTLAKLPEIVALTKADLLDDDVLAKVEKDFKAKTKTKPVLMSTVDNRGVDVVVGHLATLVAERRAAAEPVVVEDAEA